MQTNRNIGPYMSDELWIRTAVPGCPVGDYIGDVQTQQEIIDELRSKGIHSPHHFNPLLARLFEIEPAKGEHA